MASTPVVEMPEIPMSEYLAQNDGAAMNAPAVSVVQQAPALVATQQDVVSQQHNALTGKQEHCKYCTKSPLRAVLTTSQT